MPGQIAKSARSRFQELGLGPGRSQGAGKDWEHTNLWTRAKTFFTSPEGVVTIIVLAILVHYAWKGHKAGAKA